MSEPMTAAGALVKCPHRWQPSKTDAEGTCYEYACWRCGGTAAGARFIKGAQYGSAEGYFLHAGTVEWLEAQVAAIEAEAAARAVDEALSVERVAEALNAVDYHMVDDWASGDEPPTRLAALVAHLRGPRP